MKSFRIDKIPSEVCFEPKIKDTSIYGAKSNVFFSIDIEYREWGIKGISVGLKAISGEFTLENDDDDVLNEDYCFEYDGATLTLLNTTTTEITVYNNIVIEKEGSINSDSITIKSVVIVLNPLKTIINIMI